MNSYSPNTVPSALGRYLNWNCATIGHKLRASIGTAGSSKSVAGLTKGDARATANLTAARVPKYNPTNLFLRVNAYTLRRNRISQSRDKNKHGIPQHDEDVRRSQEEHDQDRFTAPPGNAPGSGTMLARHCHLSSTPTRLDLSPGL